jgi:hypothetical protein
LLSLLLALSLALSLVLSLVPAGASEDDGWLIPKARDYAAFTDTQGTITENAARLCCETGLMDGVRAGKFLPKNALTNAQIIVICARLHKLLSGGSLDDFIPVSLTGDEWYTPYADYLKAEIPDCPVPEWPQDPIPYSKQSCFRYSFTDLLAAVLKDADVALPDLNHMEDRDISVRLSETDLTLYNAGILRGVNKYGYSDRSADLSRGQAALMLARVIDPAQRLRFKLETFDLCWDIFGIPPETDLMTIDGTEVTADEFCKELADGAVTCALDWQDCTAAWSRAYVLNACREKFALEILANRRNVEFSKETSLECAQKAAQSAGKEGATEAGWLWSNLYGDWFQAVKDSYLSEFGVNNAHGVSDEFDAALADTAKTLDLKTTAAFDQLNFSAIREKLLATGCYSLETEPLFQ